MLQSGKDYSSPAPAPKQRALRAICHQINISTSPSRTCHRVSANNHDIAKTVNFPTCPSHSVDNLATPVSGSGESAISRTPCVEDATMQARTAIFPTRLDGDNHNRD